MNVWRERIGRGVGKAAAILCLVCLLACFGAVWANAAGTARITVASCSAEQDTTVPVVVRLDGNPGLWGLKLRIGYDSSAMTLEGVDAGGLFAEDELTCSESLSKNPYVIVASRGKLEDLTGDAAIVTLRFSVKAGAEQKAYPVTVEIAQAVNVAGEDVAIDAANGSVTVVKCLHEVKQWSVAEPAACEKAGSEVLTCRKCGAAFETRTLSATGHQHTEVRGAVAATQTQEGYSGDTYCTDCGKQISKGVTIAKLPADNKPGDDKPADNKPGDDKPADNKPVDPPKIERGDQASFRKDSEEPLVFVSDAEYADFVRVEVDGVTVDAKYYTVRSGSTIVTVSQDYLSTLGAGPHTLSIVSRTGTATASFTVVEAAAQPEAPESPETAVLPGGEPEIVPDGAAETVVPAVDGASDSGTVILVVAIVVCVLCAAGLVTVLVTKNRRG